MGVDGLKGPRGPTGDPGDEGVAGRNGKHAKDVSTEGVCVGGGGSFELYFFEFYCLLFY